MPKQIRDLSCSVSSFKYQLDKYLSTIPDTPFFNVHIFKRTHSKYIQVIEV